MDFLFKGLNDCEINNAINKVKIIKRDYKRGSIIFREDQLCNYVCLVENGVIHAKRTYSDGHETIIRVLQKKDTFGEALIFSSNNLYKADFYCFSNASISMISYNDLLFLINKYPVISLNLLNKISDQLVKINDHVKVLSKKSVKQKICEYLFLEYKSKNTRTFTININKTNLALLLNVERPSLSKEIKSLIDEKVIDNLNNTYTILDFEKMEKYL